MINAKMRYNRLKKDPAENAKAGDRPDGFYKNNNVELSN